MGASASFVKGVHDIPVYQTDYTDLDVEEVDTVDDEAWEPTDLQYNDALASCNPA
jgi:hypothetical protein